MERMERFAKASKVEEDKGVLDKMYDALPSFLKKKKSAEELAKERQEKEQHVRH